MFWFEHIVDKFVWPITVGAGLVSIAIFFTLTLVRFFYDHAKDNRAQRKREIESALLIHLSNPLKDVRKTILKSNKDLILIAEVSPKLIRNLKGKSKEQLLDTLKELGLYDWLIEKLNSRSRRVRISAVTLAGNWPEKRVKQRLKALLKDSHPLIKYAAVEALAQTEDTKLLPAIIREFRRQQVFSYPLMCDVFQHFGAAITKDLVKIAKTKKASRRIKKAALLSLAEIGDSKAIHEAAVPLCKHSDDELRAIAYYALSMSQEALPPKLLALGEKDSYWKVRQFLAECAGYISPLPADTLMDLLKDPNWLVGMQAAKALYDSGRTGRQLLELVAKTASQEGLRAQMMIAERGGSYGVA